MITTSSLHQRMTCFIRFTVVYFCVCSFDVWFYLVCIGVCYGSSVVRKLATRTVVPPAFGLTPNLPTNIPPTKIARVKLSGKSPIDIRCPPLEIKIMFESNPLKPTMLVGRLAVLLRLSHVLPLVV